MPSTTTTRDHATIKAWAEARKGRPVRIAYDSTGRGPEPLKIYFDDAQYDVQQSVQTLDWDEWLAIFDKMNYSFAYSEDGEDDRYHEVRGGQN